jgi:tetratricopeptide (TPR) repeat protein
MTDPLTHEDGCWQQDLASQHSDVRAEAQLQLGVHYAAQGQTEAAERAFASVDPDDDRLAAARARLRLHRLQIATGQTIQAWDALATTNELSDPRHSPDVELELAARAAALGQRDEATRRYRAVLAARTHRDQLGALAAYRLGELQSEQSARDEAVALWRLALQGADEDLRPHVLVRLADALRGRPEDREAEGLYQQALASDHPDLAPRAALALASLLEQRDALSPALALYAIACASGDRDVAVTLLCGAGLALLSIKLSGPVPPRMPPAPTMIALRGGIRGGRSSWTGSVLAASQWANGHHRIPWMHCRASAWPSPKSPASWAPARSALSTSLTRKHP